MCRVPCVSCFVFQLRRAICRICRHSCRPTFRTPRGPAIQRRYSPITRPSAEATGAGHAAQPRRRPRGQRRTGPISGTHNRTTTHTSAVGVKHLQETQGPPPSPVRTGLATFFDRQHEYREVAKLRGGGTAVLATLHQGREEGAKFSFKSSRDW